MEEQGEPGTPYCLDLGTDEMNLALALQLSLDVPDVEKCEGECGSRVIKVMRAENWFEAEEMDELTVLAGEEVKIIDDSDPYFYLAENHRGRGRVPRNMLTDLGVDEEIFDKVVENNTGGKGGVSLKTLGCEVINIPIKIAGYVVNTIYNVAGAVCSWLWKMGEITTKWIWESKKHILSMIYTVAETTFCFVREISSSDVIKEIGENLSQLKSGASMDKLISLISTIAKYADVFAECLEMYVAGDHPEIKAYTSIIRNAIHHGKAFYQVVCTYREKRNIDVRNTDEDAEISSAKHEIQDVNDEHDVRDVVHDVRDVVHDVQDVEDECKLIMSDSKTGKAKATLIIHKDARVDGPTSVMAEHL